MWEDGAAVGGPRLIPYTRKRRRHTAGHSERQWRRVVRIATDVHSVFARVEVDCLTASYVGRGNHAIDCGAVRSSLPFPATADLCYFEVLVLSAGERGHVAVGLVDSLFRLNTQPGFEAGTYGYRGDAGYKYHHDMHGEEFGPRFGAGDVVGCGLHVAAGEVFFTKNGELIGTAFRDVAGELFACASMHSPGERLRFNFAGPFEYDPSSLVQAAAARERELIASVTLPRGIAAALVREYLIHHGYLDTLSAFCKESVDGEATGGPDRAGDGFADDRKVAGDSDGAETKDDGRDTATGPYHATGTDHGLWEGMDEGGGGSEGAHGGAGAGTAAGEDDMTVDAGRTRSSSDVSTLREHVSSIWDVLRRYYQVRDVPQPEFAGDDGDGSARARPSGGRGLSSAADSEEGAAGRASDRSRRSARAIAAAAARSARHRSRDATRTSGNGATNGSGRNGHPLARRDHTGRLIAADPIVELVKRDTLRFRAALRREIMAGNTDATLRRLDASRRYSVVLRDDGGELRHGSFPCDEPPPSPLCIRLHCQRVLEQLRRGAFDDAFTLARTDLAHAVSCVSAAGRPIPPIVQDVLGLLAFEQPGLCASRALLSRVHRDETADQVNEAVLRVALALRLAEVDALSSSATAAGERAVGDGHGNRGAAGTSHGDSGDGTSGAISGGGSQGGTAAATHVALSSTGPLRWRAISSRLAAHARHEPRGPAAGRFGRTSSTTPTPGGGVSVQGAFGSLTGAAGGAGGPVGLVAGGAPLHLSPLDTSRGPGRRFGSPPGPRTTVPVRRRADPLLRTQLPVRAVRRTRASDADRSHASSGSDSSDMADDADDDDRDEAEESSHHEHDASDVDGSEDDEHDMLGGLDDSDRISDDDVDTSGDPSGGAAAVAIDAGVILDRADSDDDEHEGEGELVGDVSLFESARSSGARASRRSSPPSDPSTDPLGRPHSLPGAVTHATETGTPVSGAHASGTQGGRGGVLPASPIRGPVPIPEDPEPLETAQSPGTSSGPLPVSPLSVPRKLAGRVPSAELPGPARLDARDGARPAAHTDETGAPPSLSPWSIAPPVSQLSNVVTQLLAVKWTLRGEMAGRGSIYRLPSPRRIDTGGAEL